MSQMSNRLLIFCFIPCFIIGIKNTGLLQAQTSTISNHELVIPRIVQDRSRREAKPIEQSKAEAHPERLVYSLSIEKKDHFLHLEKNTDFVAKAFAQFSHDANGNLVTSYPKVSMDCHYHGYVDGYEDSLVALSACTGLKGVIVIGNQSYGLEPAVKSKTFEHLLFPLWDGQSEEFVCGVTSEMSEPNGHAFHEPTLTMSRFFRSKRNLPLPRYVELVIVVDKMMFELKKGNATAVREDMVELTGLLDGYYKPLNIHVILVGLHIFTDENPFSVEDAPGAVLSNFVKWRRKSLLPNIRHDVGQLVVGRTSSYEGGVLGMAFVGTVCSAASSGGINALANKKLQAFSTVVAHEIGHNLGMNHDRSGCSCNGGDCIMGSAAGSTPRFSDCSANDFQRLIFRGGGLCLKNQPPPSDIVTVAECGNGLLEKGEECDCGTAKECIECCDAATCRFKPGSVCAEGECCKDCQIVVAGTSCRESVDTCDLPEFCNGTAAFCPEDYYKMDGIPCANNAAYCFEGRCQTYDFQCEHLFGKGARKAADVCFNVINMEGSVFGNCGTKGSNYVKCTLQNSMCGKVQCNNLDANYPPAGSAIRVQDIQGHRCVNADFGLGSDVLDPAYVNSGTGCGKGKACQDFQCVNASVLRDESIQCDAQTTCHGRGVCNDRGHCHCDNGWGPPFCNRAGRGGSVDSGPAQIDHSLRDGLLIFFLAVVPLLILVAFVMLYIFKRDWTKRNILRTRRRSRNQANGAGQTRATPQAQPPNFQTPHAYPEVISEPPPSYEASAVQNPAPRQGPGVPRPITLRQT